MIKLTIELGEKINRLETVLYKKEQLEKNCARVKEYLVLEEQDKFLYTQIKDINRKLRIGQFTLGCIKCGLDTSVLDYEYEN